MTRTNLNKIEHALWALYRDAEKQYKVMDAGSVVMWNHYTAAHDIIAAALEALDEAAMQDIRDNGT